MDFLTTLLGPNYLTIKLRTTKSSELSLFCSLCTNTFPFCYPETEKYVLNFASISFDSCMEKVYSPILSRQEVDWAFSLHAWYISLFFLHSFAKYWKLILYSLLKCAGKTLVLYSSLKLFLYSIIRFSALDIFFVFSSPLNFKYIACSLMCKNEKNNEIINLILPATEETRTIAWEYWKCGIATCSGPNFRTICTTVLFFKAHKYNNK